MVRALRLVVMATLVVVATTTGAAAQEAPAEAKSAANLAVGYQFLRLSDENMAKGGFVDLSFGRGDVEGVLQVGASFKSSSNSFSAGAFSSTSEQSFSISRLVGGVRLRPLGDKASPFIHVLGGLIRAAGSGTTTSTGPSGSQTSSFDASDSEGVVQFGLGVDITLSPKMNLRLGGDYQRVLTEGGGNVWIASAGLSFGLGGR